MKNALSLLLCLWLLCPDLLGQNSIGVMFYNVENLFDISDDPLTQDEEFTPSGTKNWSEKRYWNKLNNLAKTIVAVDEMDSPAIVGLCEVENDSVIFDLTKRSSLRNAGYDYVMTNSLDKRGIDVALLFKRQLFRLVESESIRVSLLPYSSNSTRDILHVTGKIASGDTLDLFVCHWPSRIGGVEQTEPLRSNVASELRKSVENIFSDRKKPYVLIMGDLNEGPDESAVRKILDARQISFANRLSDNNLVTLMDLMPNGSYRYNGIWEKYDQFISSASFLNELGCSHIRNVRICSFDFLLEEDTKFGGMKPYRTYNGYRYQGGFSDHLPIALTIDY